MSMFGGANIGGPLGAAFGSKKEAKGYKSAQETMKQLQAQAGVTRDIIDPGNKYRASYADQLNNILTGKQSIQTDPGYQFAYQQGQQGVERAAAARGMGTSGNVMAALQQRGQDVANQQYGAIIDRLTNLAGAGSQNAIAAGNEYGNIMTAGLTGQAEARIGQGFAQSREMAAWGDFAHNSAQLMGSIFGGMGGGGGGMMSMFGG